MVDEIRKQISKLPSAPGVYIFRDSEGRVLYIGKASSIKKRVQSYFRDQPLLLPRIKKMVSQIKKIDFIVARSEIEALLLESDLIKKHQPKYNIEWKDDKNFLYIKIGKPVFQKINKKNKEEVYPGIYAVRKPEDDGAHYFGPFTDASAVRRTISFLRKIFPSRACKKFPKRPCLLYHINRCPGPCINKISQSEYKKIIHQAIAFLEGKQNNVLRDLKKEMKEAADKKEFEKAAKIRDRIFALEHIEKVMILKKEKGNETALWQLVSLLNKYYPTLLYHPSFRIECYDVSNIQGSAGTGSMVVFIDGERVSDEYRRFAIKTVNKLDDVACMKEVLKRRFSHKDEWLLPDLIILDGGKAQLKAAKEAQKEARLDIPYIALVKGKEQIYLPKVIRPISLPPDSPAILLLRQIRDEAHRFAKQYHIKLRKKQMLNEG